jgi:hypothetical protein
MVIPARKRDQISLDCQCLLGRRVYSVGVEPFRILQLINT